MFLLITEGDLNAKYAELPIPANVKRKVEIDRLWIDPPSRCVRARGRVRGPFGIRLKVNLGVEISVEPPNLLVLKLHEAEVQGISTKDLVTDILKPVFPSLRQVGDNAFAYSLPEFLRLRSIQYDHYDPPTILVSGDFNLQQLMKFVRTVSQKDVKETLHADPQ